MTFRHGFDVEAALESRFGEKNLLVIGDVMLDEYLWGNVSRISPEAPVPVVHVSRHSETAGGAGDVGLNLSGLGTRPSIIGLVGPDTQRDRLREILTAEASPRASVLILPRALLAAESPSDALSGAVLDGLTATALVATTAWRLPRWTRDGDRIHEPEEVAR